jgi:hypothetical protein
MDLIVIAPVRNLSTFATLSSLWHSCCPTTPSQLLEIFTYKLNLLLRYLLEAVDMPVVPVMACRVAVCQLINCEVLDCPVICNAEHMS